MRRQSALRPQGKKHSCSGPLLPARATRRARAQRNGSPAPPANGSTGSSSGLAALVGQPAVALQRAGQVPAHRFAGRLWIAAADRLVDPAVLFLDKVKIRAPAAHALGQPAHDAARNAMAADELQEARELRIAGCLRDRLMQAEVLVDGALAVIGGAIDGLECGADRAQLGPRGALRGEAGGLDFHAQA